MIFHTFMEFIVYIRITQLILDIIGYNMDIQKVQLPPVSERFYNRLLQAFPALEPLDIKHDTPMILIQRNAAQQEVIQFIKHAVRKDGSVEPKQTILNNLKNIFKRRH